MRTTPEVIREIAAGAGLSTKQLAENMPPSRAGTPTAPACIWRWIVVGLQEPGGGRAYLEAARVSGRFVTTRAALERFLAAHNNVQHESGPAPAA